MKNITRRLKYIQFDFNPDTQKLTITTYSKDGPGQTLMSDDGEIIYQTGKITLNKTYIFSTLRFIVSLSQFTWFRKRQ